MSLFTHSWLPYIYLYGVGGLFFFLGIIIIRRAGALKPHLKRHRKWLWVLYFGFGWYMAIHAGLIFLAFK
ncbi:MAG: hypothetical protein GXO92_08070 [FCB group bacterium]|nr:hypothetical protein [FCB group bacterium]